MTRAPVSLRLLLAMLLCTACAAPREQAFDPVTYASLPGSGTGIVEGRAAVLDENGDERVAAGVPVLLQPATPYSEEWYLREVLGDETLEPADLRVAGFVRTTTADADGAFRFSGVPAGDWLLTCRVTWRTGGLESRLSMSGAWASARLHVSDGETVRVHIGR